MGEDPPVPSQPTSYTRADQGEPAARTLARFCLDLHWDALPAPARYRTQELLLDLLGVTVRGSMDPSTMPVREFVHRQGLGSATIIGASRSPGFDEDPGWSAHGSAMQKAAPPWAALANGTAAHAIEMDDVTTESSLHPGAAVIPAALAVAEDQLAGTDWVRRGYPLRHRMPRGPDVLAAIVAGYEVTIRVGNALGAASAYRRGFHPTGVAGVFGAAVAAGKLMLLDEDTLVRALGIAGTMASGSLSYLDDGSWTKRLNPGWAAHAGVVAAGLADAGFTGPATVFEGPHGLLRGYTDAPDPERLTEGLSLSDLQVMNVSIKPYGCCRYSHGLIDAVLALRAEHRIGPDDVAEIRLGVLSGGWPLIAEDIERKRDPRNTVEAQFSAPYAAAAALVYGSAGLAEFERLPATSGPVEGARFGLNLGLRPNGPAVSDPQVRELMKRTECYRDPSLDAEYPKSWPAAVEIKLRDGRILRKRVEHALGEPENPFKRPALVERFIEMVSAFGWGGRDIPEELSPRMAQHREALRATAERILHLEREPDLSVLQALV